MSFPAVVHWHFDPVVLSLGPLQIHWYGICWGGAFLGAEFGVRRRLASMGRADVDVAALVICALLGTIAGARLAHCLFYDPAFYLAHPLRILAIWEGGMASHGGALGLIAAVAWGAPRHAPGLAPLTLLDAAAPSAAFGAAIIRGANFLNSEIVGNPTSGAWGVCSTASMRCRATRCSCTRPRPTCSCWSCCASRRAATPSLAVAS